MNFLDLLFPKRCVGCGRIGHYICSSCRKLIIPVAINECICPVCEKPAIAGFTHPRCRTRYTPDGLTSFFYYNTVVREVVKTIKYRFVRDVGSEIVGLIPISAFEVGSLAGASDIVLIPVPLHVSRLRHRGFNQAETLGYLVAKRLRIPMCADVLVRITRTTPQVEKKDRKDRLENMKNVFSIASHNPMVPYKKVILFDDVFTTGATIRAAAGVLKRHGVQFVWAVTMAR